MVYNVQSGQSQETRRRDDTSTGECRLPYCTFSMQKNMVWILNHSLTTLAENIIAECHCQIFDQDRASVQCYECLSDSCSMSFFSLIFTLFCYSNVSLSAQECSEWAVWCNKNLSWVAPVLARESDHLQSQSIFKILLSNNTYIPSKEHQDIAVRSHRMYFKDISGPVYERVTRTPHHHSPPLVSSGHMVPLSNGGAVWHWVQTPHWRNWYFLATQRM